MVDTAGWQSEEAIKAVVDGKAALAKARAALGMAVGRGASQASIAKHEEKIENLKNTLVTLRDANAVEIDAVARRGMKGASMAAVAIGKLQRAANVGMEAR